MAIHLEASRVIPLPQQEAYDLVRARPLPDIFADRYLAIPPIKETRDEPTTWDTVGQSRTIVLADGGTLREELTSVEDGKSFGYVITEVTGPMKALVAQANGRWTFTPGGPGTKVTWSWEVQPNGFVGKAAMPVFAKMWKGSANKALARIEGLATA